MVRGRLSPIRPGEIIKETLLTRGPQSINDLHFAYKQRVQELNIDQPGGSSKRRPMVYHSFLNYIYVLKRLRLVEPIREEPMLLFPGLVNPLLSIRVVQHQGQIENRVITSTRVIYDLTQHGRDVDDEWLDPFRRFKENVPPPLPRPVVNGESPTVVAVEEPEEIEESPTEEERPTDVAGRPQRPVPAPDFPERPRPATIDRLIRHLENLADNFFPEDENELATENVITEIERLAGVVREWTDNFQDDHDNIEGGDARSQERAQRLQDRIDVLDQAVQDLESQDVREAIDHLQGFE